MNFVFPVLQTIVILIFHNIVFWIFQHVVTKNILFPISYLNIFVWVWPEKVTEEACVWHIRRPHDSSEIGKTFNIAPIIGYRTSICLK